MMTNEFDRIANATSTPTRGLRFKPGTYVAEVQTIKCRPSQKNPRVTNYIFEYKLTESNNQDLPVGSICSKVEMDSSQGWENRVKAAIAGIVGSSTLTPVQVANAFSDKNPLMGQKVKIVVTASAKKDDAGEPYPNLSYFTV